MNDDVNLKPCPFCGSDDVDAEFWMADQNGKRSTGPGCMNCGATAENVGLWNIRSKEAANV